MCQNDTTGAFATITDADVKNANTLVGRLAEYIPGLAKADPKCNGFFCTSSQALDKVACQSADLPAAKAAWCKVCA